MLDTCIALAFLCMVLSPCVVAYVSPPTDEENWG